MAGWIAPAPELTVADEPALLPGPAEMAGPAGVARPGQAVAERGPRGTCMS